jgi:hypothetical protein
MTSGRSAAALLSGCLLALVATVAAPVSAAPAPAPTTTPSGAPDAELDTLHRRYRALQDEVRGLGFTDAMRFKNFTAVSGPGADGPWRRTGSR